MLKCLTIGCQEKDFPIGQKFCLHHWKILSVELRTEINDLYNRSVNGDEWDSVLSRVASHIKEKENEVI